LSASVGIRDPQVEPIAEPINNLVPETNIASRIDIPHGSEYRLAEIGSGRRTTWGKIKLDLKNTYAQLATLFLSNKGIVD
jgi:hypothetical protein